MNVRSDRLPVVVIGAGPVGLSAAVHLLSRGAETVVLEAGATVGANVRSIACALTGDVEGAQRVDLALPATGVCSGPGAGEESVSCCAPKAAEDTSDACCAPAAVTESPATGCCAPAPPVVVRLGAPRR